MHRERPIPSGSTVGHAAAIENGELGEVENEDYAGALVRFAGGAVGTVEASRVAVGPDCAYGIEIYGTSGSAMWDFERMNELRISAGQGTAEAGYVTVNANIQHGDFARFQPGAGMAMSFDDLKTIEARKFLVAVTGGPQDELHHRRCRGRRRLRQRGRALRGVRPLGVPDRPLPRPHLLTHPLLAATFTRRTLCSRSAPSAEGATHE